jgi:hypothetical protein
VQDAPALRPSRWRFDASAEGGLVVDGYEIVEPPRAPQPPASSAAMSTRHAPSFGDSGPTGVAPSVLARSALPGSGFAPGMAFDSRTTDITFRDYALGGWPRMRR